MKYRIMETMSEWKPIGFVFVSNVFGTYKEAEKEFLDLVRRFPNRWFNIVSV